MPIPTVFQGDCLEVMRLLPDSSISAIVTDPPYGLGFMGKAWDDLPPGLPWAQECLRVLKPGGHLLAFGGTRTWHRLACAIEDAGFEMRDSIAWLYGSGFPKSLDVSKAIDKRGGRPDLAVTIAAAIKSARESRGWTTGRADKHFCGGSTNWTWFEGRKDECRPPTPETFARIVSEWPELAEHAESVAEVEREVVGVKGAGMGSGQTFGMLQSEGRNAAAVRLVDVTAPTTDAARQWQGWGTALKPAFEPVVVARKPLVGTVAQNVLTFGTGAINVDAGRIGAGDDRASGGVRQGPMPQPMSWGSEGRERTERATGGRWPANVALDSDSAAALDQMSGTTKDRNGGKGGWRHDGYVGGTTESDTDTATYRGEGGASRYFLTAEPDAPDDNLGAILERFGATPWRYAAKAPKSERPVVDGVAHPTVKPLSIMRWLVRMFTPPGGLLLDPFAGSGTTVEAAVLEGFDVVGIERDETYLPLIQARIDRQQAKAETPEDAS